MTIFSSISIHLDISSDITNLMYLFLCIITKAGSKSMILNLFLPHYLIFCSSSTALIALVLATVASERVYAFHSSAWFCVARVVTA